VLSAATEVLQRAELRAVSEQKAATQIERSDEMQSAERETLLQPGVAPDAVAVETHEAASHSLNEKCSDVFGQFKSLQVSVPAENRLVCLTDNESLAAENFRFLGVRLQQIRREQPLKKVLITSTIPQEGKSMISANLACTLARRTQQKTLLVEGDVRRPSLSHVFGLGRIPGICEWLEGERSLEKSIYYLDSPGLWILPAGSPAGNPLELLQSRRLSSLMDQVTAWFDWIIIDSPPVLPLADTSVWTRLTDGILLVARQGTTEKRQLMRGLEALDRKKLIGAVLNCAKDAARSDYYYQRPSASGLAAE